MCIDCGCRRKAFKAHGHYEAAKAVWGYEGEEWVIIGYEGDPGLNTNVVTDNNPPEWNALSAVMQAVKSGELDGADK